MKRATPAQPTASIMLKSAHGAHYAIAIILVAGLTLTAAAFMGASL